MDKPLIPEYVMDYLESLVPAREPEMQAMEAYAEKTDFPIVGPSCGYMVYQVARMIGAKRIFELGSGYGYSTASPTGYLIIPSYPREVRCLRACCESSSSQTT